MDGCNLKLCLHEKGLNIQLNPNLLLGYDFQLHTTNKFYAIKYFHQYKICYPKYVQLLHSKIIIGICFNRKKYLFYEFRYVWFIKLSREFNEWLKKYFYSFILITNNNRIIE